jgi:hypothetical protein
MQKLIKKPQGEWGRIDRTALYSDEIVPLDVRLENLRIHEIMIRQLGDKITRKFADQFHLCAFGGCDNAGTVSSGTRGSENYYCGHHFKIVG